MIRTDRWLCLLCCLLSSLTMSAQELAFPGAEGYGRFTTGGKSVNGCDTVVYRVTRLDDCTDRELVPGTLRWALRTGDDTPRTVVFDVCGTIYLRSLLALAHPNVSILGQTAPGKGVCVAGYTLRISRPNVIIRYMRFRAGDIPDKSMTSLDVENVHHVIIDHCSMTWSMEENLTMYDCDSTTVQWCILAEGLYHSKNVKGARSYATQWGGEHATMHHCLIANVNNRTPRFNGMRKLSRRPGDHDQFVDNEFVNNVVFNWGKSNSVYGGECYKTFTNTDATQDSYNRVYMINNYYRPGPNTLTNVPAERFFVNAWYSSAIGRGLGEWYLSGNHFEIGGRFAPKNAFWSKKVLKRVNADNLYGFADSLPARAFNTELGANAAIYKDYILHRPTLSDGLRIETAEQAFRSVTSDAGCKLPAYDEVDARILAEAAGRRDPQFAGRKADGTLERALGIINSQYDVHLQREDPHLKGWPDLTR